MVPVVRTSPSNFADVPFASAWPTRVVEWDAPEVEGPLGIHVTDAPEIGRAHV